jgi:hypothetical protein
MIAIDIASSEEIAEIDSNAKRSPCKKSRREFIDNYCGTKELVTLLEKVANSSKNSGNFSLNGIKDPIRKEILVAARKTCVSF